MTHRNRKHRPRGFGARPRGLAGRNACAAVVALAVAISLDASSARAAPEVGKPAPDFQLRDPSGGLIRLGSLAYPGKARPRQPKQVVVLDFFRTDCKPCHRSLPKLAELHRTHSAKGLKVILIALLEDEQGDAKLRAFLKKAALPFTVLVDPYGVAGKKFVYERGSARIPALFVIDRSGTLRAQLRGLDDKQTARLSQLLKRLLAESG